MVQRNYIPWPPAEGRNLRSWLERHRHLTWEQRAAKYCLEVNDGRTSESLRSKAAQLRKKITRRRAIHPKRPQPSFSTARSARRRQEDIVNNLSMMQIPTPPVLGLTPRCRKLQAAILQGSQYQCDQLQTPRLPQEPQDRGVQQHLSVAAPYRSQMPSQGPIVHDTGTRGGAGLRENMKAPSRPRRSVPKMPSARKQRKTPSVASLWRLMHRLSNGSGTSKQAGAGKEPWPNWSRISQPALRNSQPDRRLFPSCA